MGTAVQYIADDRSRKRALIVNTLGLRLMTDIERPYGKFLYFGTAVYLSIPVSMQLHNDANRFGNVIKRGIV
jgi:hypothetical protein